MQRTSASTTSPLLVRLKKDLEPYYKNPHMVGRFLLPTVLLASGALLDNPLIATTTATAGACLALADQKYRWNRINAAEVGVGILFTTTAASIHGLLSSTGTGQLTYGANALVSLPLSLYKIHQLLKDSSFNLTNKKSQSDLAYKSMLFFFPLICFEMRQWLPSSFAAVGIGVAVWGALKASRNQKELYRITNPLPLLPIAYGTAFTYFWISQSRLFSGSWIDGVAYAAATLLHASPLFLYLREVKNDLMRQQNNPIRR